MESQRKLTIVTFLLENIGDSVVDLLVVDFLRGSSIPDLARILIGGGIPRREVVSSSSDRTSSEETVKETVRSSSRRSTSGRALGSGEVAAGSLARGGGESGTGSEAGSRTEER